MLEKFIKCLRLYTLRKSYYVLAVLLFLYFSPSYIYACDPCPPYIWAAFIMGKYPEWQNDMLFVNIWGEHCQSYNGGIIWFKVYVDQNFNGIPEEDELIRVYYYKTGRGEITTQAGYYRAYCRGLYDYPCTASHPHNVIAPVSVPSTLIKGSPDPYREYGTGHIASVLRSDARFKISYDSGDTRIVECGSSGSPWGYVWIRINPAELPFGPILLDIKIRACNAYGAHCGPCGWGDTAQQCDMASVVHNLNEVLGMPPSVKIWVLSDNVCSPRVEIGAASGANIQKIYYTVVESTATCSLSLQYKEIDVSHLNRNVLFVEIPITQCPDKSDHCRVKVCAYVEDAKGRRSPLMTSDVFTIHKQYSTADFVKFSQTSSNYWRVFEKPRESYVYSQALQIDTSVLDRDKVLVKIKDKNKQVIKTLYLPISIKLSVPSVYQKEFPYQSIVVNLTQPTVFLDLHHTTPWVSRDSNITLAFSSYDTCKIDNNNIFRSTVGNSISFDNYPGDSVLFNITPKTGVEPDWKITFRTGLFKDWGYMDKVDVTLRIYDEYGGLLYEKTKTVHLQEDRTVGVQWEWRIPRTDTRGIPIWGQKLTVQISYTAEYTPEAIRRGSTIYIYRLYDTIEVKKFKIEFEKVKGEIPLIKPKIVKPNQTIYVYIKARKLFENNETVRFCARFEYKGAVEHSHCYSIVFDTKEKILTFWYKVDEEDYGKIYYVYVEYRDPFGKWWPSPKGIAVVEPKQNIKYMKWYLLYSPYIFPEKLSMLEKLLQIPFDIKVMQSHLRDISTTEFEEKELKVSREYYLLHGLPVS